MDITIERISDLLPEKKISQKQFMADLKLSTATFSEWKAGRVKSYKKYIEEIADYLSVSVDYLLGRTDNPIQNQRNIQFDIFAERIKPAFDKSLKNDSELENALGLPRGTIYNWKNGKSKSYTKYIDKISTYLNVPVDYLLGLSDDPTPKATGAAIGYGSKEYVIRGLSKEEFDELQNYLEYQRSKAKK